MQSTGEWILALDVGTDAGYALRNTTTGEIISGHFSYKKKDGHRPGRRFNEFQKTLDSFAREYQLSRVCCEQPRGIFKNYAATLCTYGFIASLQAWCDLRELPFTGYPQKSIKMLATGKGNAKKPQMLAAARTKWPELDVKTDDEADALWVLELDRESSRSDAAA